MPSVSILMATNKCDDYFRGALKSCLLQSFNDFEVIVVANGMSDSDFESLENICSDPRIFLYKTDIRKLTFSLNLGLHYCRGELIARMDADDIAYPDRLEKQVAFMAANKDISICGTFCDLIDAEGRIVGQWSYPTKNKNIRRSMYWKNPICHPTVIYRRSVATQSGGYFGFHAEDYALWAFLSEDPSIKFANIPEKLVAYRADAPSHPRTLVRRKAKSSVAGTQFQCFAVSGNVLWLFAAILSYLKIIVYL